MGEFFAQGEEAAAVEVLPGGHELGVGLLDANMPQTEQQ